MKNTEKISSPDYSILIQYSSLNDSVYTTFIPGKISEIKILETLSAVLSVLMTGTIDDTIFESIERVLGKDIGDLVRKDTGLLIEKHNQNKMNFTANLVEQFMKEPIILPSNSWEEKEEVVENV